MGERESREARICRLRREGWSEARVLAALGWPSFGEEFAGRVLARIMASGEETGVVVGRVYDAWAAAS